jgi:Tfp pilus assembly protein PilO
VEPVRPVIQDRITTFGYTIVIEGDFFKFGELCSKFENSRRIISLETFNVDLISSEKTRGLQTNKGIRVKMRVNTYRVKKV